MKISIFENSEKMVNLGVPKKVELQPVWVELQPQNTNLLSSEKCYLFCLYVCKVFSLRLIKF